MDSKATPLLNPSALEQYKTSSSFVKGKQADKPPLTKETGRCFNTEVPEGWENSTVGI